MWSDVLGPTVPARVLRAPNPLALEGHLAAWVVHHDGNPVLRWMVANAMAEMDAAGNIKPSRDKSNKDRRRRGLVDHHGFLTTVGDIHTIPEPSWTTGSQHPFPRQRAQP